VATARDHRRLGRHGSPARVRLSLGPGEDIVPLARARTREQLSDLLGALEIPLSQEVLADIEAAVGPDAVVGERYGSPQMAQFDSERLRT
jgi:diketogulonate reductase-like aldo/keto reductase